MTQTIPFFLSGCLESIGFCGTVRTQLIRIRGQTQVEVRRTPRKNWPEADERAPNNPAKRGAGGAPRCWVVWSACLSASTLFSWNVRSQ